MRLKELMKEIEPRMETRKERHSLGGEKYSWWMGRRSKEDNFVRGQRVFGGRLASLLRP